MISRNITPFLLDALSDTPVVFLNGARQTGKSTLAQWLFSSEFPARYLTLDDAGQCLTLSISESRRVKR